MGVEPLGRAVGVMAARRAGTWESFRGRGLTSRPSLLLGRLALLALANGLLWAALVPAWQMPDEPKHFEYVRLLAERGRLVAFASEADAADPSLQQAILKSMDEQRFWWYGHAPGYDPDHPPQRFADVWLYGSHTAFYRSSPVYYWLVARMQPADRLAGLYLARTLSVLLGVIVVLAAGWTARELFPDEPFVRFGVPAFVALAPMFAFVQAGVNNDALANALAALAFWLAARMLVRGASPARLAMLVGVVAAAVLVKRTALVLVPMLGLALLLRLAGRSRRAGLVVTLGGLALVALTLALGRWAAAGGLASVPEAWRWTALRYVFNEPDQWRRMLDYLQAPGIAPILVEYGWRIHNGFWGSFGWQLVNFPSAVYVALAALGAAALAGVLRRVLDRAAPPTQRGALVLFGLAVITAAAAATLFFIAYLNLPYPPPPQGRYLFVAMVPAAVLLGAGLAAWLPATRQVPALRAWIALLVGFDLLALLGFVVPYYYR